jgi:BirA family biotin operon repressor/biotin-[acetyl-CoA-carboxylase] ligase
MAESTLIAKLGRWYETLKDDQPSIITEWSHRSTYFSGQHVRVTLPDGVIEGATDGLEPNGALRVKLADGSVSVVQAGDVERLRKVRSEQTEK